MVSWLILALSLLYFCWISRIRGWSVDMALEARSCLRVNGYMAIRTIMVKAIMLIPKLSPRIPYKKMRAFIITSMMMPRNSPKKSLMKPNYLLSTSTIGL